MPGGFHPFHAGHLALYKSAVKAFPGADVYVAASDNQKERPFPFKVKEALATVAGIPKGKFVQVKSPFRPEEITKHYNSSEDALIFVRSDKDRREHPKPGGTKKDGSPAYYQAYNEKNLKPFAEEGYIAYLPTVEFADGMTSATEIRNAWPKLDELGKIEMIKSMYPGSELSVPKVKKLVQMLDAVLVGELTESNVVDMETPMKAEFINWLKTKNLPISDLQNRVKLRNLRLQYEKESGNKLKETFVDPSESEQYWNHDDQLVGVGGQIEMPLRDTDRRGRRQGFNEGEERSDIESAAQDWVERVYRDSPDKSRDDLYQALERVSHADLRTQHLDYFMGEPLGINLDNKGHIVRMAMIAVDGFDKEDNKNYVSESLNKIRGMIKETTDEQKSKSVDLHRKLFELFEEERNNVTDLSNYRKQRQMQSNYLTAIEEILMGLHEEFAEMEQLKLMPVDLLDTFENIKALIKYIQNYDPVKDDFPFPKDLVEKLHLKTVQLKEYLGGMRDRSAPRVLRKQEPKSTPKDFWNKIDLSETSDYIEEK